MSHLLDLFSLLGLLYIQLGLMTLGTINRIQTQVTIAKTSCVYTSAGWVKPVPLRPLPLESRVTEGTGLMAAVINTPA